MAGTRGHSGLQGAALVPAAGLFCWPQQATGLADIAWLHAKAVRLLSPGLTQPLVKVTWSGTPLAQILRFHTDSLGAACQLAACTAAVVEWASDDSGARCAGF